MLMCIKTDVKDLAIVQGLVGPEPEKANDTNRTDLSVRRLYRAGRIRLGASARSPSSRRRGSGFGSAGAAVSAWSRRHGRHDAHDAKHADDGPRHDGDGHDRPR